MKSNVRQRGRSEWSLLIKDDHWKLSGTLEQKSSGDVVGPAAANCRAPMSFEPMLSRFNKEIDGKSHSCGHSWHRPMFWNTFSPSNWVNCPLNGISKSFDESSCFWND